MFISKKKLNRIEQNISEMRCDMEGHDFDQNEAEVEMGREFVYRGYLFDYPDKKRYTRKCSKCGFKQYGDVNYDGKISWTPTPADRLRESAVKKMREEEERERRAIEVGRAITEIAGTGDGLDILNLYAKEVPVTKKKPKKPKKKK